MDQQTITDYVSELTNLINNNNDQEAYRRFGEIYSTNPLVTTAGDDTILGQICNPIGLDLLHMHQEWQRERDWWQNVITVMEDYDRNHGVQLHKGLAYHNMTLPLLEMNLPEEAADFLLKAIQEDDRKAGNTEPKGTPAYNMACFLLPIVKTGKWRDNDNRLSQQEKKLLIEAFSHLFVAFDGNRLLPSQTQTFNKIQDDSLKKVLLRRYNIIEGDTQRDPVEDAPRVAIYAGSIIEGFLTFLLRDNFANAITEYRRLAGNNAAFVNYLFNRPGIDQTFISNLINDKAPIQGTDDEKKKSIDMWDFNQKIKVALGINLFGQAQYPALGILCHLLREYRNIVHPTSNEAFGTGRGWDLTFEIDTRTARMLKTAVDIVLSELNKPPASTTHPPTPLSYTTPTLGSLASPGMPARIDENGRVISIPPHTTTSGSVNPSANTVTETSSYRTSTNMGSTTTATLPEE